MTQSGPDPTSDKRSDLEAAFDYHWRVLEGPPLVSEYRFAPDRQWRADRAYPPGRILIELEGGTWGKSKSRHTTGQGFRDDCLKYNRAAALGWRVFRLTADMVGDLANLEQIIEAIRDG